MKLVSSSITVRCHPAGGSPKEATISYSNGVLHFNDSSSMAGQRSWDSIKTTHRRVAAASIAGWIMGKMPTDDEADQMYKVLVALTQPALAVKDEETPLLPGIPDPDAIPPDPVGVAGYCSEIGVPAAEAQRFMDFHTARGWMMGKVKMKDWRAALRTWKANGEKWAKPAPADDGREAVAHVNRLTKDRRGK